MSFRSCEYCNDYIHPEDAKLLPDDLPDDLPYDGDVMVYHSWCFEDVVSDYRMEIHSKHIADCPAVS